MDTDASVPIVAWKLTKKQSHIISDISVPGCLPHSGFSQRFKLNVDSPSMSEKDIGLLYCLIERLLFTNKITRPDIHACVSYIITRMELTTNYHKDGHLNVDVLFVKKIWLFVLSSMEDQCMHLELLFPKHTKYLLNILQQSIQSQRLKNIFAILGGVSKNMKEWIRGNLRTDQINYTTNSQLHTTDNAKIATNELMNQGVSARGVQCYSSHQESILSNIFTESYIYDNYSYASCVNWEIEKTPETHPKKLEFNMDKSETSGKK